MTIQRKFLQEQISLKLQAEFLCDDNTVNVHMSNLETWPAR